MQKLIIIKNIRLEQSFLWNAFNKDKVLSSFHDRLRAKYSYKRINKNTTKIGFECFLH